ncbi:MAG TPA: cardiolipin synthase [Rubricoccaceae bacterium]|nr:cardiolipin synthase [Rubricoccaceae bacterium]
MPGDGVLGWVVGLGVPALYALGIGSAYDALMKARTAQGATAWVLALLTVPLVALPLYWIFGRVKFSEYVRALRDFYRAIEVRLEDPRRGLLADYVAHPERRADDRGRIELRAFQELATFPFTRGNDLRLLVDGRATFDAIFAGIEAAERYILAQFYIIRDDGLGREFQRRLIEKARAGVRVYLLYDEVGCYDLPKRYLQELKEAGVRVSGFSGRRSWRGRFRLNFRNHRKIVVVDGVRGYMGGLNVGDEYLGLDPKFGPWRDTHVALEGPVVQGIQFAFLKDWYYGREEVLDVEWRPAPSDADLCALVLASGPADRLETCGLLFSHAIESAERRVWIATPYFVPDGAVLGALQLAALRGVDVRLIMPRKTDAWFFKYVPYAYLPDVARAGVKAYLYEEGFMHQKILLVDDDYAAVSTANLDNRSFRLNFELTVLAYDRGFCGEVERMLEADLARSTPLTEEDLAARPFFFRLAVQTTRLMSPVL